MYVPREQQSEYLVYYKGWSQVVGGMLKMALDNYDHPGYNRRVTKGGRHQIK